MRHSLCAREMELIEVGCRGCMFVGSKTETGDGSNVSAKAPITSSDCVQYTRSSSGGDYDPCRIDNACNRLLEQNDANTT